MANLTITVDERLLKRARIKAIQEGTSVNAVLRDQLERYAGSDKTRSALEDFASLAAASTASSGPGGRTWTRDDLHDRAALR